MSALGSDDYSSPVSLAMLSHDSSAPSRLRASAFPQRPPATCAVHVLGCRSWRVRFWLGGTRTADPSALSALPITVRRCTAPLPSPAITRPTCGTERAMLHYRISLEAP